MSQWEGEREREIIRLECSRPRHLLVCEFLEDADEEFVRPAGHPLLQPLPALFRDFAEKCVSEWR